MLNHCSYGRQPKNNTTIEQKACQFWSDCLKVFIDFGILEYFNQLSSYLLSQEQKQSIIKISQILVNSNNLTEQLMDSQPLSANAQPQMNGIPGEKTENEATCPSQLRLEDQDPQTQQKWRVLLLRLYQLLQEIEEARNLRSIQNRQFIQSSKKKRKEWKERMSKNRRQLARELQQYRRPKPTMYETMAAFIKSLFEDERQEFPKDMYSVENVQNERQKRSKPPKKGYYIRSKKSIDINKNF